MAGLAPIGGASAEDISSYPTHSVTFIIPSSPGGGTDFVARALADAASNLWGKAVVPENHGGASGAIGMGVITREAPDGYSLGSINVGQLVAAEIKDTLTIKDLTPIALTATSPQMLVAYPGLNVKSVKDLVDLASKEPGKLNFGSTGLGGTTHLAMQSFMTMTGIKMTHVPYKGTGPVIPDLLKGRIQLAMASPPSVEEFIKSGKLLGLAITGKTRSPALPDVPTFAEAGYPDYDMSTWFGIFGPAGMSPDMVKKLNADFTKITSDPKVVSQLAGAGIDAAGGLSPAELLDYMNKEAKKWDDAAKDAGLR
jgi:tripartite-type tricarboxylate transporter receptor subunit TctC